VYFGVGLEAPGGGPSYRGVSIIENTIIQHYNNNTTIIEEYRHTTMQ